ncbi:nicotinate-nucleotide--dimethylbenzimidazole phosphoribosyltransferase [Maribellus sp. YY47]|uniref:nicotinate-nucleotide--dimethylbenzimidazole phosphoribosyltransferase n=1 Tax=Maribellus sp. YY47 TaxID=2929486 RepID=UPI002000A16D|nr:nicotinate-nucleotide--dimethylbenzimidazole phosphoribosyltransferase [Maribellus sp. YY47]MCK3685234.1 nicotinate-nucleotide--dimethylbenzimidazole phosphoribosyltransferase [Maribellus sp. YY47]
MKDRTEYTEIRNAPVSSGDSGQNSSLRGDFEGLLQQKINLKTKPLGSLGRLEELAFQTGMIQQTLSPRIYNPSMVVFAADHGLADEGISPYPKDVTWQMVMNFCAGGAAINVFCKQNGLELKVVDAGVDHDFPADLPIVYAKIRKGSRNMYREPAMTMDECREAMKLGAAMVVTEAKTGCNTIAFGEMGIGNTSASSLLMHKFTGISVEECTGRGAGLDDKQLDKKACLLKEIADKYRAETPEEILAAFGGLEIAAMVGAFLEAKKQNMLILVDGFIATVAALTASKMNAEMLQNCIFCHQSDEKGHKLLLDHLNVKPLVNLGLRLGEGTGAAVALPLVRSAVSFLNEMASFEDAGVSNK